MSTEIIDTLKVPDNWPHRQRATVALHDVPPGYTSMIFRVPHEQPCRLHARWLICHDCGLRWREWRADESHALQDIGPCPATADMPRFVTKQASLIQLGGLL